MIIYLDHYLRGKGVIEKFDTFSSLDDLKVFMNNWLKEHNLTIVSKEYVDNSYWNYLNDGSELDYTIEP